MNTPQDTNTKRPGVAFWLRAQELRKHKLTHEYRKGLKDKAREGISEEDLRITEQTLEKMARNLGWDESQRDERGFGRRGFGRRHAMLHGHGHDRGHGHGHQGHSAQHPHDDAPQA